MTRMTQDFRADRVAVLSVAPSWMDSLLAGLRHGFGLLREWHDRLEVRAALGELPDRTLQDLGLTRGDVDKEIARPFWRPIDYATLERLRRVHSAV